MKRDLLVVSNNKGKIKEFKAILNDFNVFSLEDLKIDLDVEETGSTFRENALLKVEALMDDYDYVIADDSGLEIAALDNQPGVYSARFLGHDTPYEEKNVQVIEIMKDKEDRRARFISVIAFASKGDVHLFEGVINGEIAYELKGTNGFGYNPIFYIPKYKQTMAEIDNDLKNTISHRAIALQKLKGFLDNE